MQVGIDLGGTKIEAAVLDEQGHFRFRERLPTPRNDYPATLQTIRSLVRSAEAALGTACVRIGVGHPGSTNPLDGRLRNANSTCLNGQTLQVDLEALLRRPVSLANDADCLALSEATDGAARGFGTVFGVILGTGVGGGWVVNGQLRQGPNRLAGEWGHNPLPIASLEEFPGPFCYCGKQGCIEAWLSGPALLADYQHATTDTTMTDGPALISAALLGNADARSALSRHTQRLARALATMINACDPDAIVLGGGVAQRPNLIDDLSAVLPRYVFLPSGTPLRTELLLPLFGDSSGVRGAARLFNTPADRLPQPNVRHPPHDRASYRDPH
ncbi:MAG: ROK family protein [Fluviibacter sp.]